jgi:asparagine synthase (glutamine-hydrolysing)
MFAFSLWDHDKRKLFIGRDHVGIKPLYIYEDDNLIAWASEIKALFVLPGIPRQVDELALIDFLTFGYVPAPRTMFKGIRKLPPAHFMTIENGQTTEREYWDLHFEPEERSMEDWSGELLLTLDQAVKSQMMSDVPLGAFLSGGLDSSAIVASMRHLGVDNISTYAIGFGDEDSYHSELGKAERVAKLFETNHHPIVVNPDVAELMHPLIHHMDEPITDTSFLVSYLVSKMARESVTVILSGIGGDEVFGGYRRYLWPEIQRYYGMIPGFVDKGLIRPCVNAMPVDRGSKIKGLFRYMRGYLAHADKPPGQRYQGYVQIFDDTLVDDLLQPDWLKKREAYRPEQIARHFNTERADPLEGMLYADLKTSLVDSLLAFTDKVTMAVSLEARVPLLDIRILELAARMPSSVKIQGTRGLKQVLKQALSGRLPDDIIHQRKQGFGTPISRWFRGSLRPMIDDLLSPSRLEQRGFFRPDTVQRIVADHMSERADHSEHLLALLTFEIWQQVFLDEAPA